VHIFLIELKQWYVWLSFVFSNLVQDESSQMFQRIYKQIHLLWNTKKVTKKELKHDKVNALNYTFLILKQNAERECPTSVLQMTGCLSQYF